MQEPESVSRAVREGRPCLCSKAFSFTRTAAVWQVVLGQHDRGAAEATGLVRGVHSLITHASFKDYQHDIGEGLRLTTRNLSALL